MSAPPTAPDPRLESAAQPTQAAAPGAPLRLALLLALAVLAIAALPLADALEWRRGLLATQPWRVFTGHWVHLGWTHAAVNAAALVLMAWLYARWLDARRLACVLVGASLGISLMLAWAMPQLAWYRGLSGVLHALFFAGALVWLADRQRPDRWLAALLLAGGAVKLAFEGGWQFDTPLPWSDWLAAPVVPQAHLAGAVLGLAAGALLIALRGRRKP